jgi:hypothetical protein
MRSKLLFCAVIILVAGLTLRAQRRGRWFGGAGFDVPIDSAPKYDGRFTFARLKFPTGPGGFYFGGLPAWAHGYVSLNQGSRAERNLVKILQSISDLQPHVDATAVVDVGSSDLFKYPVVYATEPGYMMLSDAEAKNLGDYLRKGGFVIFDDFRDYDWTSFEETMARVLPGERLVPLDVRHPIFHAFFDIKTLEFHQAYDHGTPEFYGMSEGNDPNKPLQVIANFNNDVSQYWEYSDTGFVPIDLSNEAYKLGVNYVIYSMTH